MPRLTFTQLQDISKDYIQQSSGSFTGTTVADFIKYHINKYYHFLQRDLESYVVEDLPQTTTTVADQQRYHYPPNVYPPIKAVTMERGGVNYDLEIVNSQRAWNQLNQTDYAGSAIPQFFFPMRDYFELWPIPVEDGDAITLYASLLDRDMTQEDYTTGTVTVTNNSDVVVGAGTTFTTAMVGRWFKATTDGNWYRISGFTDTTHITLESYFEGTTQAGDTYIIGETPELPPEMHDLIPHGVAADFYAGPGKDFDSAQKHLNYFYTGDFSNPLRQKRNVAGGLLGAKNRYSRRGEQKVINKGEVDTSRFNEVWNITLS